MASRQEYTACMAPHMKGTGLSKEERNQKMCVGAKLCSGTASNEEEATQICLSQPAKEPKPRKSRGGKASPDPAKLASCLATTIDPQRLTKDNLTAVLEEAIKQCTSSKAAQPAKPVTYKRFMNKCIKESDAPQDFVKSQSQIRQCQARWNEIRGS